MSKQGKQRARERERQRVKGAVKVPRGFLTFDCASTSLDSPET